MVLIFLLVVYDDDNSNEGARKMKNYFAYPIMLFVFFMTMLFVSPHLNDDKSNVVQELNTLFVDSSELPSADDNGKQKTITASFANLFVLLGIHILISYNNLYINTKRRLITNNPVFYQSNYVVNPPR